MSEPLIVSGSGLRGVVGDSLTPGVAARHALAFAATLPPGPIVAGRDVVDCGIAATPTVGIQLDRERA